MKPKNSMEFGRLLNIKRMREGNLLSTYETFYWF